MGQDVVDGKLRESGHAHGGSHVVGEHQEGGAGAAVEAEVRDPVKDGPHRVLADAVVEVAASVAASCIEGVYADANMCNAMQQRGRGDNKSARASTHNSCALLDDLYTTTCEFRTRLRIPHRSSRCTPNAFHTTYTHL